jgi:hypothetical protein
MKFITFFLATIAIAAAADNQESASLESASNVPKICVDQQVKRKRCKKRGGTFINCECRQY